MKSQPHAFQAFYLMAFGRCQHPGNQYHSQNCEHTHQPQVFLGTYISLSTFSHHSQTTSRLFLPLQVRLHSLELYTNSHTHVL